MSVKVSVEGTFNVDVCSSIRDPDGGESFLVGGHTN